jgi:hypothetical protein
MILEEKIACNKKTNLDHLLADIVLGLALPRGMPD